VGVIFAANIMMGAEFCLAFWGDCGKIIKYVGPVFLLVIAGKTGSNFQPKRF